MDPEHLLNDRLLFTPITKLWEIKSSHPFVPAALELLKDSGSHLFVKVDLDMPNTTEVFWADHKQNTEWQKNTSCLHTFIPSPGPSPPEMALPRPSWVKTIPPTYWCWTVPLNNAQMWLGALGELQMQSRGANGRSHTNFMSPVPPSKWETWFGGSRWWHCGLAQNEVHWKSDDKIGPNEEGQSRKRWARSCSCWQWVRHCKNNSTFVSFYLA